MNSLSEILGLSNFAAWEVRNISFFVGVNIIQCWRPEDGVIIGASGVRQQNCTDSEDGPLPEEVIEALDEAHKMVGSEAPSYWR